VSGLGRELTRNRRVEELEARVAVLLGEVAQHRAAIAGIEKFLKAWSDKVNADIAWIRLPWWKRTWMRIERRMEKRRT